eukprot:TCONS_00057119-protein
MGIEIESEYVSSKRGEQIDSNISADFTIENDISPKEVSTPIKSKDSKQPEKKKDVIKKPVLLIYDRNFKLVIDNLDTHHKVSNITEKNLNIDLHPTAKVAVFYRAPPEASSDTKPHCTISELDNSVFICTPEDHVIQRLNLSGGTRAKIVEPKSSSGMANRRTILVFEPENLS